jgi:predicted nicotinamide N-methyase
LSIEHPLEFATGRKTELLAELEHVGPLRVDTVALPRAGVTMRIVRPEQFDHLLDHVENDPEQNLPYWAELWPSGIALAAAILQEPRQLANRRVLELGCGLGVTAIAALRAGADLLVTDYAPEALALCALNTIDQAGAEPTTLRLNWRQPNAALFSAAGAGFPVVLAADVLYEARDVEPLLELVERVVAADGALWLAEPGRKPARAFLSAMRERGWQIRSHRYDGPWPDPEDNRKGIVVSVHKMTRVKRLAEEFSVSNHPHGL